MSNRFLNWLDYTMLGLMFILPVLFWNQLPDKVPLHFNGRGEPGNYNPKYFVFMWGLFATGLYSFMRLMSMVSPEGYNFPFKITPKNKSTQYRLIQICIRVLATNLVVIMALTMSSTVIWSVTEINYLETPNFFPTLLIVLLAGPLVWYLFQAFKYR